MSLFFPQDTGDRYDYFPGHFVYGDDIYVDDYYMDEKWWYTDIPGYMVSNKERVWSEKSQKFLKLKKMDKHGHLGVCLSYAGRRFYKYIHRMMADAFMYNRYNAPIVRHLDDNPENNELENLEWGTQYENMQDCKLNGRFHCITDEEREIGFAKARIPVLATNLETGESIRFRSQTDAARELGIQQANIWKVLNGERPRAGGYSFKYLPKD